MLRGSIKAIARIMAAGLLPKPGLHAPSGLNRQFRVPSNIHPIPPRVVELLLIHCHFDAEVGCNDCVAKTHTANGFLDFPFKLR
jgi:hypothetical protein